LSPASPNWPTASVHEPPRRKPAADFARQGLCRAIVFEPANLLREARRQKGVPAVDIPEVCILDPDGDIVRALRRAGRAALSPGWACYHTDLFEFDYDGMRFGIIGCAVGAAFAVLLAEELFVSACRLLISVTSAGQICVHGETRYFVVINRALRDWQQLSLPAAQRFRQADLLLVALATDALRDIGLRVYKGASWTTDAPFPETAGAIEQARERGILALEMEAAGLYAFARARQRQVLCLAHVTNRMAVDPGDFEKGEDDGARASLALPDLTASDLKELGVTAIGHRRLLLKAIADLAGACRA
jgi:purine-nucleoside phosphorylase